MSELLGATIIVTLVVAISGFFARRAGKMQLALPIVIAAIGTVWLLGALTYYQRTTGRELQGLVGYHHSVPEWGFKYAPGGTQIERWSFHVPGIATVVLLLASAIAASMKQWRMIGARGTLLLWVYHFGCATAFLLVYAVLWIRAASVFI